MQVHIIQKIMDVTIFTSKYFHFWSIRCWSALTHAYVCRCMCDCYVFNLKFISHGVSIGHAPHLRYLSLGVCDNEFLGDSPPSEQEWLRGSQGCAACPNTNITEQSFHSNIPLYTHDRCASSARVVFHSTAVLSGKHDIVFPTTQWEHCFCDSYFTNVNEEAQKHVSYNWIEISIDS